MIAENIHDIANKTEDLADDTIDTATKLIKTAKNKSSAAASNAKDHTENTLETLIGYVKNNPIKAIGIAALIGMAAGFIYRH